MGYAPSPARKHIGKTRLGRRHIVFFGNCQAGEVARLCRRFLAPRSGDIVDAIDVPLHDARSARQLLAKADVIVEQVFDNRQEIWLRLLERDHVDIRAEYHDRKIIRFPTVTGIFYWPYANQPHPRNAEIEKGYDAGPYPDEMGDSFLNRRIAAGVSPDEALKQYLAEDVSTVAEQLFQIDTESQRKRDQICGFRIADYIATHFRDQHLFSAFGHPSMQIFEIVAEGALSQLDYDKAWIHAALQAQRVSPFPRLFRPIHPGVIRHFGLRFVTDATAYPFYNEGSFTFAEYVRRYMGFEWNMGLRDAIRMVEHDPDRALPLLDRALELSPRSAVGMRIKSELLLRRREYELSLVAATRATELDPNDLQNWLALSRAYRADGDFAQAKRVLDNAAAIAPIDAELRLEYAHIASACGSPHLAVEEAERAVSIEPGAARCYIWLSEFQARAGQLEKSIEAARRVIELEPTAAAHRLTLADRLTQSGQLAEAIEIVQHLFRNGEREAAVISRLGRLLMRSGNLDKAEAVLREALMTAPDETQFHFALADILDRKGLADEALAIVQALVEHGVRDRHSYGRLGYLLYRAGDLKGAEAAFRQAIEASSDKTEFRRALSDTLERQGRVEEALGVVRGMLADGAKSRPIYRRLGHLLAQTGDIAAANTAYRQANGG